MAGAAANLNRLARELRSLPRKVVDDVVKDASKSIEKRLSTDSGGDRVLSGTTRGGKRVALRVLKTVKGDQIVAGKIEPGPRGRTVAIWHWLEYGVKPHMIGAREHPGSPAKGTWSKSATPALDRAQREVRRRLGSVMQ